MKIGIYMAYGSQVVLGREGLGRYVGNLISGFVAAGHQVTIACPKWSLDTIDDLLQDFQVDAESVEFIVSNKIPALWRLYERKYKKRHPKRTLHYRLLSSFADFTEFALEKAISITSMVCLMLLFLLAALLCILALPVVLLLLGIYLFIRLVLTGMRKGKFSIKTLIQKIEKTVELFSSKKKSLRTFVAEQLEEVVSKNLAEKINRSAKQDVWFVPALFWPAVKQINGIKVICAPDLVTAEFALQFADWPGGITRTQKCRDVLKNEEHFITYSEYLRKSLVMDCFGKDEEQVIAIPHATNNMSEYIQITSDCNKRFNSNKDFGRAFAEGMTFIAKWRCLSLDARYITKFYMPDTRYIFYASQIRPHKNIFTLVKAYEYLLRKRYWNIKLIITGDFGDPFAREIYSYTKSHRLEYDILSFPNVSAQELASLYRCADLVVNPTLYEGGFPFTFGEGMSVGTPSVMSDIPQVREVVEPFGLCEEMLFDPYDWRAMADKIEYALKNRDALYQKELPLYRELEKRTGSVVAEEYVHAFEYFIEQDKLAQIS